MSPISATSSRWLVHRAGLAMALSGLLAACGGGGGTVEVPRFESTTVSGVAAVRDNTTGIVWAAQLDISKPSGADVPTAAELLQLTDLGGSVLDQHFSFVQGKLIKAQPVVGVDGRVWTVDFGYVAAGGLSDQAATDTDVNSLYVLSRRTTAPSVAYFPASNGTVTAGGLIWKVCSEGSTWSGSVCEVIPDPDNPDAAIPDAAKPVTAAGAQALADAANTARFAGATGWRVPTRQELRALLQLQNDLSGDGNLLPTAFSVDSLGVLPQYWSSTVSSVPTEAWVVDFSGRTDPGGIDLAPVTDLAHVRLVRTAP